MLPPHLATPLLAADEIEEVGFDLVLIYPVDNDATKDAQRASIAARCRTLASRRAGPLVTRSRCSSTRCSTLKMEEMAAATKMPMRPSAAATRRTRCSARRLRACQRIQSFSSMEDPTVASHPRGREGARRLLVDLDGAYAKTLEQVLPIHEEAQVQRLFRSWCLALVALSLPAA